MIATSMEDMKLGLGDWKNIQPIVRATFHELNDVVAQQSRRIAQLEQTVHALQRQQADAEKAQGALGSRVETLGMCLTDATRLAAEAKQECMDYTRLRLESAVSALQAQLQAKADTDAVNTLLERLASKELVDLVSRKIDLELEDAQRGADAARTALRKELQDSVREHATTEQVDAVLRTLTSSYATREYAAEQAARTVCDALKEYAAAAELRALRRLVEDSLVDVREQASSSQETAGALFADLQERAAGLAARVDKLAAGLSQQAGAVKGAVVAETVGLLEKLNRLGGEVTSLRGSLEGLRTTASAALTPESVVPAVNKYLESDVYKHIGKIVKCEVQSSRADLAALVDERVAKLQEKMARTVAKAIVRDGMRSQDALDERFGEVEAKIDSVRSSALDRIKEHAEQLDTHLISTVETLKARISALNILVDSTDALISVPTAKWLWKNRRLSASGAIVWSSEVCNTLQNNFIWDKGKSAILICQAGCYRLEFVVFGRKRPTVQFVVNGEPLIAAMSGGVSQYMYVKPKGDAVNSFVGQSLVDFIFLGENSKIQLVVVGEAERSCVSGFFAMQKVF